MLYSASCSEAHLSQVEDLDNLNIVHIAGTKGKGSTAVFTEPFLKAYSESTGFPQKIGLYTLLHMRTIRERIRINHKPISEKCFASYFLPTEDLNIPRYLQLLALLSFQAFMREMVDAAIYETHCGGEYDATNIIAQPVVIGLATIGLDHMRLLGPTIENIAWHKAGIMNSGCPAFSTLQEPRIIKILEQRAVEKDVTLNFVGILSQLSFHVKVLEPMVQKYNASLALALVDSFLKQRAPARNCLTTNEIVHGVEQFDWPGRFHHHIDGHHQWFLDGAHNALSMQHAVNWFAKAVHRYSTSYIGLQFLEI